MSSISGHPQSATSFSQSVSGGKSTLQKASPAFSCASADTVKFSGHDDHDHDHATCCGGHDKKAQTDATTAGPGFGQKLLGGVKEAGKRIFNPKSLLMDAVLSGVITLATCWLPGSQLLTIPLYLSVMAAFRMVSGFVAGFQNPKGGGEQAAPDQPVVVPPAG